MKLYCSRDRDYGVHELDRYIGKPVWVKAYWSGTKHKTSFYVKLLPTQTDIYYRVVSIVAATVEREPHEFTAGVLCSRFQQNDLIYRDQLTLYHPVDILSDNEVFDAMLLPEDRDFFYDWYTTFMETYTP